MQPNFCARHNSQYTSPISAVEFASASPASLYDFSGLGKLSQDAGFVREMQQMFIERVPVQIAELQRTIDSEDWITIAQQAHSLKATFGNLRIEPSTTLLKELEHLAFQHRDKLELTAIMKVVATTADAVVSIFRQELSRAA
jgi:two-component system aerobic respiration control sensor histidine kinase ArcB